MRAVRSVFTTTPLLQQLEAYDQVSDSLAQSLTYPKTLTPSTRSLRAAIVQLLGQTESGPRGGEARPHDLSHTWLRSHLSDREPREVIIIRAAAAAAPRLFAPVFFALNQALTSGGRSRREKEGKKRTRDSSWPLFTGYLKQNERLTSKKATAARTY